MPPSLPLAVVTSGRLNDQQATRARTQAQKWNLPFIERKPKTPLAPLFELASALLVFDAQGVTLRDTFGALRFHEGLARLRIGRLDGGFDEDLLVRLAELKPGDTVLDCTLGLAQDAMVSARAVGPTGRVIGIEKSFPIFAVVSEGLKTWVCAKACRIEPVHHDALEYLAHLPPKSFDCVVLDPMFDKPAKAQPSFEALRRHACFSAIGPEWVRQARRVARRCVLVKGRQPAVLLDALQGVSAEFFQFSRVAWAKIAAESLAEGPFVAGT
jgi:16S rRNA (guanine1516-N2)-methyltransferase